MQARLTVLAVTAALLAFASPVYAVDMHGYFRDGVGGSSKGGDQVAFGNSGQGYKLRLANEDNWGEWQFDQMMLKDKNGVEWTASVMVGWGDGWTSNQDDKVNFELKQHWLKGTFPQLGGASVWGGKRYYHRQSNDIFDYFYVDQSGSGAGIEDLDVGFGKVAVAVFRKIPDYSASFGSVKGSVANWYLDARLENMPLHPGGSLTVGAMGMFAHYNKELNNNVDQPDKMASASPFIWAQYRLSEIFNGGNTLGAVYKGGTFLDGHEDSHAIIVSDDLLLQPTKLFSVVVAGVYKNEKSGFADVTNNGFGIGVRPLFKVTDHIALQGDLGYFYNKDDKATAANPDEKAMTMFKATFAPTITPFTDGFAWGIRPEIRFYVTYATWNEEQRIATFGTDDNGLTFGTYVETWF